MSGRPTYPRWPAQRFARLPDQFRPIRERLVEGRERFSAELPPQLAPAAVLVQSLGSLGLLSGNDVELLADQLLVSLAQRSYYDELLEARSRSSSTVGRCLRS